MTRSRKSTTKPLLAAIHPGKREVASLKRAYIDWKGLVEVSIYDGMSTPPNEGEYGSSYYYGLRNFGY